jgi:Recombination endonuclease VII
VCANGTRRTTSITSRSRASLAAAWLVNTGRVRGLLCFSCNVGIGNFHQAVGHMMRAADYVDDDGSREELAQVARARRTVWLAGRPCRLARQ